MIYHHRLGRSKRRRNLFAFIAVSALFMHPLYGLATNSVLANGIVTVSQQVELVNETDSGDSSISEPTVPTITAPLANQYLRGDSTVNSWTASSDASGIATYQVRYEFAGRPTAYRETSNTSRKQTFKGTYQGPITISVRAQNNAGKWSNYSPGITYYYDSIAPNTDITVSPVADNSFTVSGNAADNIGLNYLNVQLANTATSALYGGTTLHLISDGTSSAWSVKYNTSDLPDGNYTAHVSVSDMAGNTSTAGWTAPFSVATINPEAPPEESEEPVDSSGNETTGVIVSPPQDIITIPAIALRPQPFTTFTVGLTDDGTFAAAAQAEATDEGKIAEVSDEAGQVRGASNFLAQNVANQTDGKVFGLFGIAWYWILAALAALSALWRIIAGKRRKQDNNNVNNI